MVASSALGIDRVVAQNVEVTCMRQAQLEICLNMLVKYIHLIPHTWTSDIYVILGLYLCDR